ncbi:MAG: hypothetical protein WAU24_01175 [Chitinophagaceae bacterium]
MSSILINGSEEVISMAIEINGPEEVVSITIEIRSLINFRYIIIPVWILIFLETMVNGQRSVDCDYKHNKNDKDV